MNRLLLLCAATRARALRSGLRAGVARSGPHAGVSRGVARSGPHAGAARGIARSGPHAAAPRDAPKAELLRPPLGPALDRDDVSRALARARTSIRDGEVLWRPQVRERLGGPAAAADAVFDAMTGGRGPVCSIEDVAAWEGDEAAFLSAVFSARSYGFGVTVAFNFLQTCVYYVLFVATAARELFGHELLWNRGLVEPTDAAAGLALAAAVAVATTLSLQGD